MYARKVRGGLGAAALGITALEATALDAAGAGPARASASSSLTAGNAALLPLRRHADPADSQPAGPVHVLRRRRQGVTRASEWPASAAELSDLMQY